MMMSYQFQKMQRNNYYQPYPLCFIQYKAVNDVKPKVLPNHYSVTFNNNYHRMLPYNHIININGSRLHSQNNSNPILFGHYMSHVDGYLWEHLMTITLKPSTNRL